MSVESITQIVLKANEEIIKRTKQKRRGSFYMVGKESYVNIAENNKKPQWQYEGIDFIDQVVKMSNNERTVMKLIKDGIKWDKSINSYNFIVELHQESLAFDTNVDESIMYNTFLKGFKLLHKKDLVRRVRKGEYMFNPEFFILTGEQVSYFQRIWDESKQYSKENK